MLIKQFMMDYSTTNLLVIPLVIKDAATIKHAPAMIMIHLEEKIQIKIQMAVIAPAQLIYSQVAFYP